MPFCSTQHPAKRLAALFAAAAVFPVLTPLMTQAQPTAPTRPAAVARPLPATAPPTTATPAAAPAESKPIPANLEVAATVNNDRVLMADINAVVARIQKQQPNIPATELDNIKREICEDLIVERLLVQEAKRMNLMPDKQKVDDAIWTYQKPFLSQAAYQQHLKDGGKTEADLRRMLSEEMAVAALSRELTKDLTVSDDEVASFYNEHKADFVVPEMVRIRHIQLSVKKDAPAAERAKAKKRAEEALKKATAKGADFAALANEYSDDKVSAPTGGDLGFIARDDIVDKAFGDVAFTGAQGKVHDRLVETNFGYNILKIEEKKPSRTLALSEVTTYIKPRLMQQKVKTRLDARVGDLRKAAIIKKNI